MSKQGSGRMCVFCGERKADSKEHALPSWTNKYLPSGESVHHSRRDSETGKDRYSWKAQELDVKVGYVCEVHCNNGWMSDLETAVEPFIGGLIKGHGRTLYRDGQRLVAFWAVKTAMMLQFAVGSRVIPESHLRSLYANRASRSLPAGCQVWVAACADLTMAESNSMLGGGFFQPIDIWWDRPHGRVHAYGATFSVGHLAFQVFGHELGEAALKRHISDPLKPALLPIWPYQGPVKMPPDLVIPFARLEEVADTFSTDPGEFVD